MVGLGSRLGRDDAVGLLLAEALARDPPPGVTVRLREAADALTLAQDLLELCGPVLFVDAAALDAPPGDWRLWPESALALKRHAGAVSTHGLGLAESLAIARDLGFSGTVHLFGVAPFDLTPGSTPSAALTRRLPGLLEALRAALNRLTGAS
ncbi:MAG: hydrogenase maturation protease [Magnetococcales bacterium]|nr:hydrogenase maturation protease [Magnetococcales bacterium]